jgi:hypothetical protein
MAGHSAEVMVAWDDRPGLNVEHIAAHGLSTGEWEALFFSAPDHDHDQERAGSRVAEGRHRGRRFRIVYDILEGTVVYPVLVFRVTGFRIARRGLRRPMES